MIRLNQFAVGEWMTSALFHLQYQDWGETLEQAPNCPGCVCNHYCVCAQILSTGHHTTTCHVTSRHLTILTVHNICGVILWFYFLQSMQWWDCEFSSLLFNCACLDRSCKEISLRLQTDTHTVNKMNDDGVFFNLCFDRLEALRFYKPCSREHNVLQNRSDQLHTTTLTKGDSLVCVHILICVRQLYLLTDVAIYT